MRDGDRWIISGSKIWSSGAYLADWAMCLARTDWSVPKHRGLTWFAVPTDAKGVTIRQIRQINGNAEFCEEFLDEVEVTDDDVIGEVNQGWSVTQTMLVYERGAGEMGASMVEPRELAPDLVALARRVGRTDDPAARQAIAKAHINDYAQYHLGHRIADRLRASATPDPAVAAYGKLASGVLAPIRARLAMEVGGPAALTWADGDEDGGRPALNYLNGRRHVDRRRHQRDAAQRHRRAGAGPAPGAQLRHQQAVQRGPRRRPQLELQSRIAPPGSHPPTPPAHAGSNFVREYGESRYFLTQFGLVAGFAPSGPGARQLRRGSMWILGPGPAPGGRWPWSTAAASAQADGGGDQRAGIDHTVGQRLHRVGQGGGRRQDADGGHVVEHDGAGVDGAGRSGQADQHQPPARLHPVESQRRQGGGVGGVDHGVEGHVGRYLAAGVGHATCARSRSSGRTPVTAR